MPSAKEPSAGLAMRHAPPLEQRRSTAVEAEPLVANFATTPVGEAEEERDEITPHRAVITFDNTKAGLAAVDKQKTEAIIASLSEGSNYYKNEERKLKDRQRKVGQLLEQSKKFESWKKQNPSAYSKLQHDVDSLEASMEKDRYTHRIFAHMDMDMFYAAVEEKKNPELRKHPIGVGSMSMLSTTNYVARQFGVRAGMAGFVGKKLCPELILVPPDFASYKEEALSVRRVAELYDPNFVCLGWDELTMELTPYLEEHFPHATVMKDKFEAAEMVVAECRSKVHETTQLTASAGIAPTTALAKMASNYNKPNGQYCLALETGYDIRSYLRDKSVRSIQGIGKSTEFLLNGIQIQTLGELYDARYRLAYLFPPKTFSFLLSASIGSARHCYSDYDALREEGDPDPTVAQRKSVGEESTFAPVDSPQALQAIAAHHLHTICERLTKYELLAQHLVLKLKHRSFHIKYTGKSLNEPTDNEKVLGRVLDGLLSPVLPHFADYRLLGVRAEKLVTRAAVQEVTSCAGMQRTISELLQGCRKRRRGRESDGEEAAPVSISSSCCSLRSSVAGSSDSEPDSVIEVVETSTSVEQKRNEEGLVSRATSDDSVKSIVIPTPKPSGAAVSPISSADITDPVNCTLEHNTQLWRQTMVRTHRLFTAELQKRQKIINNLFSFVSADSAFFFTAIDTSPGVLTHACTCVFLEMHVQTNMLRVSRWFVSRATGIKLGSETIGTKAGAASAASSEYFKSGQSASSHKSSPVKKNATTSSARKNAGKLRFDSEKAGLQLVDKAYVERVIQESSKGSAFYQKEQRRDEARREKIASILQKASNFSNLTESEMELIKDDVDRVLRDLEDTRDISRRYVHIDMDMFYAAVEEKKNPSLRDVPFGVGSRQMLSTTNYLARQYGVRSGMPGFIGQRLCPDMVIVPNDFVAYEREAKIVHQIATRYDADFVSIGLDELTMDITTHLRRNPSASVTDIAHRFREEVFQMTQLTCSAGIAPTSMLAKIASNVNKPNGQHEIRLNSRQEVLDYVKDIPLRKIPGIGYAQEQALQALDIKTCGDILKHKYLIGYLFQPKTARNYLMIGLGLMETHTRTHRIRQSIGKEVSFSSPLSSEEALKKLFRRLLEPVHAQCVRERMLACQLKLVIKYRNFDTQTFSISLPQPTNDLKVMLEAADKILEPHLQQYNEYRLVGCRLQKLIPIKDASKIGTTEAAKKYHSDYNEFEDDEDQVEVEEEVEQSPVFNASLKAKARVSDLCEVDEISKKYAARRNLQDEEGLDSDGTGNDGVVRKASSRLFRTPQYEDAPEYHRPVANSEDDDADVDIDLSAYDEVKPSPHFANSSAQNSASAPSEGENVQTAMRSAAKAIYLLVSGSRRMEGSSSLFIHGLPSWLCKVLFHLRALTLQIRIEYLGLLMWEVDTAFSLTHTYTFKNGTTSCLVQDELSLVTRTAVILSLHIFRSYTKEKHIHADLPCRFYEVIESLKRSVSSTNFVKVTTQRQLFVGLMLFRSQRFLLGIAGCRRAQPISLGREFPAVAPGLCGAVLRCFATTPLLAGGGGLRSARSRRHHRDGDDRDLAEEESDTVLDGIADEEEGTKRTKSGKIDRRHGPRTAGPILATRADVENIERLRLELPQALTYKLHTMDNIGADIRRTVRSHQKLYKYAPGAEGRELVKDCNEVEERLQSEELGTSFYLRVIDLADPSAPILTRCNFKPFVPFEKSRGLAWELGDGTSRGKRRPPSFLYHHPPPTSSRTTAPQKAAVEQIKKILQLHFSSVVIEPIEGELACDVTLYAKYRVLYERAVTHVRQYKRDLDNIIQEKYIKDFDFYGINRSSETSDVKPLTPEAVAMRMAAFFKSTIFSPDAEAFGVAAESKLRVVIGIARTPVQAKLACDTEVAVLISERDKESKLDNSQFVRVRSFHKHFKSLADEKKFISSFQLAQIPTVNPPFAKFLQDLFNVAKAEGILTSKKALHFSLSKTTFVYCMELAYGRMRFPHEIHTPLFSSSPRLANESILHDCASNAIGLLNKNRTALRADVLRLATGPVKGQHGTGIVAQGTKFYGRLASNKKYVEAAEEATHEAIAVLCEHHLSTAALSLEDRRGSRRVAWESVSFPRTSNPQIILRVVRHMMEKMAQQRKRKEFEDSPETFSFAVRLFQLEPYNLLPMALSEGISTVIRGYQETTEVPAALIKIARTTTVNSRHHFESLQKQEEIVVLPQKYFSTDTTVTTKDMERWQKVVAGHEYLSMQMIRLVNPTKPFARTDSSDNSHFHSGVMNESSSPFNFRCAPPMRGFWHQRDAHSHLWQTLGMVAATRSSNSSEVGLERCAERRKRIALPSSSLSLPRGPRHTVGYWLIFGTRLLFLSAPLCSIRILFSVCISEVEELYTPLDVFYRSQLVAFTLLASLLLEGLLLEWPVSSGAHSPSLLLCGASGSGKSYLCKAVVRGLRKLSLSSSGTAVPQVEVLSPSLAEAAVSRHAGSIRTTLRRMIHRGAMSLVASRCATQLTPSAVSSEQSCHPTVLLVVLDHLEIFCSATGEGHSSNDGDANDRDPTSCESPHAAVVTDMYTLLRASPPLFTREELEFLGLQHVVLVGCFSGDPQEVHPMLSRSFDAVVSLPTPTEAEREQFFVHALRTGPSALADPSVQDAAVASLATAIALRSGGITYCGLSELRDALPTHVREWFGTKEGASASASPAMCAALAQRAVQAFQQSTSVSAALFRRSAGYVDVQVTRWGDIAGLEEAKEELQQMVLRPLQGNDVYRRCGVRPSTGILLHGPPGTGKTMLAKAMATELNASFVYVDLPGLIKAEVGESEKHLNAFFTAAVQRSPAILFIDEVQAAFGKLYGGERGVAPSGSSHEARLVSHLLQWIDAVREDPDALVVIVAATNLIHHLDPLVLRAGRLDTHVRVPLPGPKARAELIQRVVRGDWFSWFRPLQGEETASNLLAWRSCLTAIVEAPLPQGDEPLVALVNAVLETTQAALITAFAHSSDGLSGAELRNATTIFATECLQRFAYARAIPSEPDPLAVLKAMVSSVKLDQMGHAAQPSVHVTLHPDVQECVRIALQRMHESKLSSSIYAQLTHNAIEVEDRELEIHWMQRTRWMSASFAARFIAVASFFFFFWGVLFLLVVRFIYILFKFVTHAEMMDDSALSPSQEKAGGRPCRSPRAAFQNFLQRQELFAAKREMHREALHAAAAADRERLWRVDCTFSPKLSPRRISSSPGASSRSTGVLSPSPVPAAALLDKMEFISDGSAQHQRGRSSQRLLRYTDAAEVRLRLPQRQATPRDSNARTRSLSTSRPRGVSKGFQQCRSPTSRSPSSVQNPGLWDVVSQLERMTAASPSPDPLPVGEGLTQTARRSAPSPTSFPPSAMDQQRGSAPDPWKSLSSPLVPRAAPAATVERIDAATSTEMSASPPSRAPRIAALEPLLAQWWQRIVEGMSAKEPSISYLRRPAPLTNVVAALERLLHTAAAQESASVSSLRLEVSESATCCRVGTQTLTLVVQGNDPARGSKRVSSVAVDSWSGADDDTAGVPWIDLPEFVRLFGWLRRSYWRWYRMATEDV
eukprot:gene8271-5790_t